MQVFLLVTNNLSESPYVRNTEGARGRERGRERNSSTSSNVCIAFDYMLLCK